VKRTNYFGHFENKSTAAEDRLTRAFLVLVRIVPQVQAAFIDAIREKQRERGTHHVVPSRTTTDVGVGGVWSQTGDLHADEGRVLSILLTGDDWDQDVEVRPSDRSPVYDGVVHYGEQWIFAIENKPYGDVRESQLHPNVEEGQGLQVDPHLVVLVWKDLIRRLHALGQSEWLDYTQRRLVDDFLRYAQDEFPQINPYPTLMDCDDDLDKLNRRCEDLMQEIAPGRVETHRDWRSYIEAPELDAAKMVSVSAQGKEEDWEIELVLNPADTVSQARTFYSEVDASSLLNLTSTWDCTTNLHFSHISKNLVYPRPDVSLERYVQFWQEHSEWIRQVKEEQFDDLLTLLGEHALMTAAGREEFISKFVETDRSTTNVCPGISLHYRWNQVEAVKLDRESRLQTEIDDRVREAVLTWGAEDAWSSVLDGRE